LGLLREDMTLARRFLGSPFALDNVWGQVARNAPIRERPPVQADLPVSDESKRVMAFATKEADQLSSNKINGGHLFLGLLREEKCLAAKVLNERGIRLDASRASLVQMPHDDSATEDFVWEKASLPEVVELQTRIRFIKSRVEDAVANRDFAKAREYSDDERKERDKLYLVCQQHSLPDWLHS